MEVKGSYHDGTVTGLGADRRWSLAVGAERALRRGPDVNLNLNEIPFRDLLGGELYNMISTLDHVDDVDDVKRSSVQGGNMVKDELKKKVSSNDTLKERQNNVVDVAAADANGGQKASTSRNCFRQPVASEISNVPTKVRNGNISSTNANEAKEFAARYNVPDYLNNLRTGLSYRIRKGKYRKPFS